MKSLISIAALLLALPILQNPPTPPPPQRGQAAAVPQPTPLTAAECKCSIDVTVKRQSNGEPIGEVSITASYTPPSPTPAAASATPAQRVVLTATTDNAGHAVFPNLAEANYQISAQREGYFGTATNGNSPTQVNLSASVGPAATNASAVISALATSDLSFAGGSSPANLVKQPIQHIVINMIQGGVISGRVQDANHRPATGVQVVPLQMAYQNGQRLLRQNTNAVQTDDLGQFRLYWFAPGEYYLRIAVQNAAAARGGGPNFPSPTYYPGTLDLERAAPIVVREGQEVSGADFGVQTGAGVTVSGTVINTLPGGRVNPNGQVNRTISQFFLVPRNANAAGPPQTIPAGAAGARGARGAADATEFPFEIRGVPPGAYDFYPIFNDGATPRANVYTGHVAIEVGSENITGVKTAIQPGVDLKVHVSLTGTVSQALVNRPGSAITAQNIRMQLRPADNLPNALANGLGSLTMPDADGNVTLTNLPEARFQIANMIGMPTDSYISEMRQGSRSIMDDGVVTIGREEPDPLEIVVTRNGGAISGTIQDAQHKPVAGVRVFLVPDPPRRRNILIYKNTNSTTMGAFNMQGIAPGAYKIFAFDNIPQSAEQNEEFISRYDGLGTRIIVSTGTPLTNVQVSLIQANR